MKYNQEIIVELNLDLAFAKKLFLRFARIIHRVAIFATILAVVFSPLADLINHYAREYLPEYVADQVAQIIPEVQTASAHSDDVFVFITVASGSLSGSQSSGTWTVPLDWNSASNSIEVIGGGGTGGDGTNNNGAGGGGGGGYGRINNLTLTSGGSAYFSVGASGSQPPSNISIGGSGGHTWFGTSVNTTFLQCYTSGPTLCVSAEGGEGGRVITSNPNAFAGGVGGNTGSTSFAVGLGFAGGNGGVGHTNDASGGGGGAAGPGGAGKLGNRGGTSTLDGGGGGGGAGGGLATNGINGGNSSGGDGGAGYLGGAGGAGNTGGNGNPGINVGSGGGGGDNAAFNGGAGAAGAQWTTVHGSGGGGGGASDGGDKGGQGGKYGGGGGGAEVNTTNTNGRGADGIIAIRYTPLAVQSHFRWYNEGGTLDVPTSPISAEDIKASSSEALAINTPYRLRLQIANQKNHGSNGSFTNDKFRLEMIRAGTSCINGATSAGWNWTTVPITATLASHAFTIQTTFNFIDGASTSAQLLSTPTGAANFTNGYGLDTRATSGFQTIADNAFTEIEWALKPTSKANTSADYCFRAGWITDASTNPATRASMSYSKIASASVQTGVSNPTFTQNDFEWFYNDDNVTPAGSIAGAENTYAEVGTTTVIPRLRMNITVGDDNLSASQQFKLQEATSTNGPWTDVDSRCSISDDCTSSWLNRRKITFNNSASSENLIDFPILVTLNTASGSIDYSKTKDAGEDIRFVDAGGTASLSYEIEKWDETGTSYIWVKVPQIDATSTTDYIWMYYNNTGASDGQSATNVWGSSYTSVWHLGETVADEGTVVDAYADATSNNNDGDQQGPDDIGGQIGLAQDFDGTNDYITVGTASGIDVSAMSYSAWVYPINTVTGGTIIGTGTGTTRHFEVVKRGASPRVEAVYIWSSSICKSGSATGVLPLNTWTHIAVTYDRSLACSASTIPKIYINGVDVGVNDTMDGTGGALTGTNKVNIGTNMTPDDYFPGIIDEARISSIIRSADWVEAEYNWTSKSWDYNTFGDEENLGVWKFKNNAGVADGTTLASNLVSTSEVSQTYNETNPTITNPHTATIGQDIEYDWSLDPADAVPGTTTKYYFRMVESDGTVLSGYDNYPSIRVLLNVDYLGAPGFTDPNGGSGGGVQQGGGGQGGGGDTGGEGSGGGQQQGGGGQAGGGGASPVMFEWSWLWWLLWKWGK